MNRKFVVGALVAAVLLATLWAAHHVDALGFLRQLHGG
jgi:hypothetical protein